MKTYLFSILALIIAGCLSTTNAQTIQSSIKRSSINWNEDIIITDANVAILQNADISTSKNITIAVANHNVELNNAKITCNQITITSANVIMSNATINCANITLTNNNISMNNVTIDCANIIFDQAVNTLTVSKSVNINSQQVVFRVQAGANPPPNLSIRNNGAGELSITGVVNRNNRPLIFQELQDFKVTIKEN